mmetsp:Transcript_38431/g.27836  ORF Transcript_38431/g.27836 Transcript_38431/m.27836 type:complete len:115 (+) Transcript_38431:231-575(+)
MATASLIMETSAFALPNAAVRSSATKKRQDGDLSIVSADYTIRAEWDTAYVVDVTVVVDCDDSVQAYKSGLSGWKIEFALPVDTKIRGAQCSTSVSRPSLPTRKRERLSPRRSS